MINADGILSNAEVFCMMIPYLRASSVLIFKFVPDEEYEKPHSERAIAYF